MKSNLMTNLKEYFVKMSKKYPSLNGEEYLRLLDLNKNEMEELLLESEMKEYDLSIKENEYDGCDICISFHYNSPNVTYSLDFTKYIGGLGEIIYDLTIYQTKRTMCKSSLTNATPYEQCMCDKNEEDEEVYDESRLYEIANIQEQIAWKNKYIELEVKRLDILFDQLSELGA
jgi:hypothetical protein